MTTAGRTVRTERSSITREAILAAAERLFAEHGVYAVSNRQVSEAAGQGNNAAVGYHFGTKADLVRAIVQKHRGSIERLLTRMVAEAGNSAELRDWIACMVCSLTEHLDQLGNPTWYARFAAQALADPAYQKIVVKDALASPSLLAVVEGITRCLPDLPMDVVTERNIMVRNLMMHTCADFERAFAEGACPEQLDRGCVRPHRRHRWAVAGPRHGGCRMKVTVDQDKCVSGSACEPSDVFDQRDDDGVVILLTTPHRRQAENAQAAAACPASVISSRSENYDRHATETAADIPEYPMDRDARCPFAPPPQMLEMGTAKPLSRVKIWNGSTPWLITGHELARELFADSRVSVDDRRDGFPHWNEHMLSTVYKRPRSVFTSDAEEHTRYRRMLSKPFTFKRVEGLRSAIQEVTDECIDSILAGPQPADIVTKLALPVPTRVISEMLGVPYEDHEFFHEQANVGLARYATPEAGQRGR